MPYIFGYGSLVEPGEARQYMSKDKDISYAMANGFKRIFNVAVDNMQQLIGYKYYIDTDGHRPEVYVTFLNIVRNEGCSILGSVFYVDSEMLQAVDRRERNYNRVKFNEFLDRTFDDTVWAYIGKEEAVKRFEFGKSKGISVITKKYYNLVESAFESIGEKKHFEDSTMPIDVKIMNLKKIVT